MLDMRDVSGFPRPLREQRTAAAVAGRLLHGQQARARLSGGDGSGWYGALWRAIRKLFLDEPTASWIQRRLCIEVGARGQCAPSRW
jgi:hypothetical protein